MTGILEKLGSENYWDITRVLRRAFQKKLWKEKLTQEDIDEVMGLFDIEFKICKYRLERLQSDLNDFKDWIKKDLDNKTLL